MLNGIHISFQSQHTHTSTLDKLKLKIINLLKCCMVKHLRNGGHGQCKLLFEKKKKNAAKCGKKIMLYVFPVPVTSFYAHYKSVYTLLLTTVLFTEKFILFKSQITL